MEMYTKYGTKITVQVTVVAFRWRSVQIKDTWAMSKPVVNKTISQDTSFRTGISWHDQRVVVLLFLHKNSRTPPYAVHFVQLDGCIITPIHLHLKTVSGHLTPKYPEIARDITFRFSESTLL